MSRLFSPGRSCAAGGGAVMALMVLWGAGAMGAGSDVRVVEITAQRFSFTPNLIRLKAGEPVKLRLRSSDVTHGLFVRPLKIDAEILPGKVTEVDLMPDTPGTYLAICDHFCGVNHGAMKMTIVVE